MFIVPVLQTLGSDACRNDSRSGSPSFQYLYPRAATCQKRRHCYFRGADSFHRIIHRTDHPNSFIASNRRLDPVGVLPDNFPRQLRTPGSN